MTNNYQQPPVQPQQPPQQPPQYNNYYQPKPPTNIPNIFIKMAKILCLVFAILAVVSILYNFIFGIIAAVSYGSYSYGLGAAAQFFNYFATGIFHASIELFFAVVCAFVAKKG